MIQRPQTLFLLAVIAICIMLMFSNTVFFIAENIDTGEKIEVEFDETKIYASDGSSQESNTYLVAIAAGIAF